MKEKIIVFVDKMVLPLSFILILLTIVRDYNDLAPWVFVILTITNLVGATVLLVINIMKLFRKKCLTKNNSESLKERLYRSPRDIIERVFTWYLCIYLIIDLHIWSISFTYLMLVIFGIYYGCRLAERVDKKKKEYIAREKEKKIQIK